jgi:hypothetical protein
MLNFTWLSDDDDAVLRAITSRDWRSDALLLGDQDHEKLAARGVALGAVACHGFANFYAISTHPSQLVVRYVNQVKGRPADQVGSVTSTRDHIPELFDWSKLPEPLTRERVMLLVDRLLELGPFGFRGPAAAHIPQHLTSLDGEIRTTQIISGGYRCPSNRFLARCLKGIDENFLYITSANLSHFTTGNSEEPAHWRLHGLQQDFGAVAGILMLAHRDERRARRAYPRYAPSSTTILGFHRVSRAANDRLVLRLERHGSLHVDDLRPIVNGLGFDLEITPKAQQRLPIREYDDDNEDLLVA